MELFKKKTEKTLFSSMCEMLGMKEDDVVSIKMHIEKDDVQVDVRHRVQNEKFKGLVQQIKSFELKAK